MAEFKFFCPQCGRQIQCDPGYAGTQINCPGCQQPITVPPPTSPAKSKAWRIVLITGGLAIVLAGLLIGGWVGYSKIKARIQRGNLPPGLVAFWAFEGNGRDSAGHNDLTIGDAGDMTYAEGRVGQAMSQTGNNSAFQLPGIAGIDFNQDFTLSVWLYRERSTYDNDAVFDDGSIYVAKRDASPWDSKMGVYITSSDKRSLQLVDNSSMGQPPLHKWFHVLVYRKGKDIGIKVNNEGTAIVNVTGMHFRSQPMTYVGQQQNGYPWQGRIDEFCLWNRALTSSEMSALYDASNGKRP
jgi:hypothetical protein